MARYRQHYDGDWVTPVMRGYLMKCCTCGVVHRFNFKVVRWGRGHSVKFQISRHKKPTKSPR